MREKCYRFEAGTGQDVCVRCGQGVDAHAALYTVSARYVAGPDTDELCEAVKKFGAEGGPVTVATCGKLWQSGFVCALPPSHDGRCAPPQPDLAVLPDSITALVQNVAWWVDGKPHSTVDFCVCFHASKGHPDLARVLIGASAETTTAGQGAGPVLTLDQAQRVGVAILRAVDEASGQDWNGSVDEQTCAEIEKRAQEDTKSLTGATRVLGFATLHLLREVRELRSQLAAAVPLADHHAVVRLYQKREAEARADFLACAQAIGVSYETEGQGSAPGPVDEVVKHITEARHAAEDLIEWQAWAEGTASIGLDLTDPSACLPDDDRRVLIRETCQEHVVVRGALEKAECALAAAEVRVAELEADTRCSFHAGQSHGEEAEELRAGIESTIANVGTRAGMVTELRDLLDRVDARDSLMHLEATDELEAVEEERDAAVAALTLARHDLSLHAQEYEHRTSPETLAAIAKVLDGGAS